MRIVLSSTLALLVGMGAAVAFPTAEVPTSEAAYMAKVKTAAPEEIVVKATNVMTQDGKDTVSSNRHQWLHLSDQPRWHAALRR
jgi:hypothetical protein